MQLFNPRRIGSALALFLAAGCSDSGTEALPTPTMGISVESTNLTVQRGQPKTFPVTISRSGGFSGSVFLTVTGLPGDLSAGCSPASVLGSSTTLTVLAAPAQGLGAFTATLKASASGVPTKTILLTINVTP